MTAVAGRAKASTGFGTGNGALAEKGLPRRSGATPCHSLGRDEEVCRVDEVSLGELFSPVRQSNWRMEGGCVPSHAAASTRISKGAAEGRVQRGVLSLNTHRFIHLKTMC